MKEALSVEKVLALLFHKETFLSGVISSPQDRKAEVLRVEVRPIVVQGSLQYQFSHHYKTKVIHKNLGATEAQKILSGLLGETFQQALFQSQENDYHIFMDKAGQAKIRKKAPTKSSSLFAPHHNRKKNYILEEGVAVDFLVKLEVMNAEGSVHADKRDKFKQINRFLEIVRDAMPILSAKKKLRVLDFGCGKAYLTFALYHYLHNNLGHEVEIMGLDLKEEVITKCQKLAKDLGYKNLQFALGDIESYEVKEKIDMMVTLHACDIATDKALEKAIRGEADVILSVPCCQHELFSQVDSAYLKPILDYGLLKERFAALATDAARGKILEILGYTVQMIEFIALEHTAKNVLIRAVRKKGDQRSKEALQEYRDFADALHIKPYLGSLVL